MKDYIAAGGCPARFWDLTPRLFVLEMEGMVARQQREQAMVWWGATMPRMKKPPSFEEFTGIKPRRGQNLAACIAAWDRIDRALMRNKKG
ncbi:hypothetical protein [Pararhodobacter zhoushanensis]|uniref:Uncharacterized protein n=1 Tax=Pararhodobacter zhoushanensis TaxID=2479545 RepID=A0ABT3GYR9_9RHOB|nr:hypothetical protein [Pararhodobacter zhoushanensis]MCW1932610.1 hypothetical protein [Pararhodobacter zhoushanensis]